ALRRSAGRRVRTRTRGTAGRTQARPLDVVRVSPAERPGQERAIGVLRDPGAGGGTALPGASCARAPARGRDALRAPGRGSAAGDLRPAGRDEVHLLHDTVRAG